MALDKNFKTGITDAVKSLVDAEKLDMANVIFPASSEISNFSSKYNVLTDVRNGNLVPIISQGNNYGSLSASQGNCGMNECDLEDTYSTKKWVLGEYDCRVPICIETFSDDFKLFWGMYNQTLENPLDEPDKKAFLDYINYKGQQNVQGALWRTSHWGDTTSLNALISKNNGFWTEAEAGDGIKIEMLAGDLTGKQIYDYMSEAYLKAGDMDWFDESNLIWKMSNKTARALVTWLNTLNDSSQYNCTCIDPSKVVAGRVYSIDNLSIFGIPVKAEKEGDQSGKAVGQNPDFRFLLINELNLLVGTETNSHLDQFDVFYDKKDRKIYMDMKIEIGASIPLDEYVLATQATA